MFDDGNRINLDNRFIGILVNVLFFFFSVEKCALIAYRLFCYCDVINRCAVVLYAVLSLLSTRSTYVPVRLATTYYKYSLASFRASSKQTVARKNRYQVSSIFFYVVYLFFLEKMALKPLGIIIIIFCCTTLVYRLPDCIALKIITRSYYYH